MKRRRYEPKNWEEARVRKWITSKRGILTKIAVRCQVTAQFVQAYAYGKSTALPGHMVESELKKEGWPGISRSVHG